MAEKITVLVVEDEWLVRMDLADAFEGAGFAVLESSSGEQALSLVEGDGPVALLVTDIRLLGDISGWDLAHSLRSRNEALPVLYVSANEFRGDLAVAGSVYLAKPAAASAVVDRALRLLDQGN